MNETEKESWEERDRWKGAVVFGVFGFLCLLMLAAPGLMFRQWGSALVALVGLLMVVVPPVYRLKRWAWVLGLGFLGCAALGLLPVGVVSAPPWRAELLSLGLPDSGRISMQPLWTWQSLAAMAVTVVGVLYLMGHRIDHGEQHRIAAWFVGGVALLALLALAAQQGQWRIPWDRDPGFGFFPNRNHFGTLLAMGVLSGLGVAVQSLRIRRWFSAVLVLSCVGFLLTVIVGQLGSRAAVLLVAGGFGAWVLLMGGEYLGARLLTTVGMLAAVAGLYFQSADSEARDRLAQTGVRAALIAGDATEPGQEQALEGRPETVDARLLIQRDTLGMVRDLPLTGVGAGQFAAVFPLYRNATAAQSDARSLHPESDWLLVASECGLPAVLLLAGLVGMTCWTGVRAALRGHARALRMGCVVAALVLPVHGFGDVPAHHTALVWVAAWLLAMSVRGKSSGRAGRVESLLFRLLGMGVMVAAGLVVWADRTGFPPVVRALEATTAAEVDVLFLEDQRRQAEAREAGLAELPDLGAADPLEKAKARIGQALGQVPMSAHLHGLNGLVQIPFSDTEELVLREFALQRALDPLSIRVVLDQSMAWAGYFPGRVAESWGEALRRAALIDAKQGGTLLGTVPVFGRLLASVRKHPSLVGALVATGRAHPEVIAKWAEEMGPVRVDGVMSGLARMTMEQADQQWVATVWQQYGRKGPPPGKPPVQ